MDLQHGLCLICKQNVWSLARLNLNISSSSGLSFLIISPSSAIFLCSSISTNIFPWVNLADVFSTPYLIDRKWMKHFIPKDSSFGPRVELDTSATEYGPSSGHGWTSVCWSYDQAQYNTGLKTLIQQLQWTYLSFFINLCLYVLTSFCICFSSTLFCLEPFCYFKIETLSLVFFRN